MSPLSGRRASGRTLNLRWQMKHDGPVGPGADIRGTSCRAIRFAQGTNPSLHPGAKRIKCQRCSRVVLEFWEFRPDSQVSMPTPPAKRPQAQWHFPALEVRPCRWAIPQAERLPRRPDEVANGVSDREEGTHIAYGSTRPAPLETALFELVGLAEPFPDAIDHLLSLSDFVSKVARVDLDCLQAAETEVRRVSSARLRSSSGRGLPRGCGLGWRGQERRGGA